MITSNSFGRAISCSLWLSQLLQDCGYIAVQDALDQRRHDHEKDVQQAV